MYLWQHKNGYSMAKSMSTGHVAKSPESSSVTSSPHADTNTQQNVLLYMPLAHERNDRLSLSSFNSSGVQDEGTSPFLTVRCGRLLQPCRGQIQYCGLQGQPVRISLPCQQLCVLQAAGLRLKLFRELLLRQLCPGSRHQQCPSCSARCVCPPQPLLAQDLQRRWGLPHSHTLMRPAFLVSPARRRPPQMGA